MKRVITVMMSIFYIPVVSFAYDETNTDANIRVAIQKHIDTIRKNNESQKLMQIENKIVVQLDTIKSERLQHHLQRLLLYLQRIQKTVENTSIPHTPSEFLQTYIGYVTSSSTNEESIILKNCLDRYDAVDAVARRENFSTALILATRRKESSCRVVNPANGDGLFQIVANYYEPSTVYQNKNLVRSSVYTTSGGLLGSGRIVSGTNIYTDTGVSFISSGNILEEQVIDFIKFSREKWKMYDRMHIYDTIPISLTYTTIDLLSLRKHAILYNGIGKGRHPENAYYANQNFGREYEKKQDGLVTLYLKILQGISLLNK